MVLQAGAHQLKIINYFKMPMINLSFLQFQLSFKNDLHYLFYGILQFMHYNYELPAIF